MILTGPITWVGPAAADIIVSIRASQSAGTPINAPLGRGAESAAAELAAAEKKPDGAAVLLVAADAAAVERVRGGSEVAPPASAVASPADAPSGAACCGRAPKLLFGLAAVSMYIERPEMTTRLRESKRSLLSSALVATPGTGCAASSDRSSSRTERSITPPASASASGPPWTRTCTFVIEICSRCVRACTMRSAKLICSRAS